MFYWKPSPNRIFFLNEYWIFIPLAIFFNYYIITCQIRLSKNNEQLKRANEQLEQLEKKKRLLKILAVSLGLNVYGYGYIFLLLRGGSDFIKIIEMVDTDYIKCDIAHGLTFLDSQRLKKIIIDLYGHKRKGRILYITATAACHLANLYGQMFLAVPFAVRDFGLTNVYQTFRKGFVTLLLGGVGPMVIIGNPISLMFALALGASGLRLAFTNLDFIPTSPLDITKGITPRIPETTEVVIVNNRDKIVMTEPVQEKQECWLPDQHLLNPNCKVKPTEIPDAIDSALPNLKYEEIVNMQDVTGLDRVEFTDKFDLGQPKPSSCNPPKGKEVNFLDKFGDSEPIGNSEQWDTCDNDFMVPEKKYLRTRNKP